MPNFTRAEPRSQAPSPQAPPAHFISQASPFCYRGTSFIKQRHPLGPYSKNMRKTRSPRGCAVSYEHGTLAREFPLKKLWLPGKGNSNSRGARPVYSF